ncbi:VOC family protein [Paenarthrobacter nicotinovorans]|uniref:VOC family protein n=1 Tax=Paenarthrobacter nicotinovorans TaxID=29320 RepID=UPI0037FE2406
MNYIERRPRLTGVHGVRLESAEPLSALAFYATMTHRRGQPSTELGARMHSFAGRGFRVQPKEDPAGSPWTLAFGTTSTDDTVAACLALGAVELDNPYDDGWRVMLDPLGTRFAVVMAEDEQPSIPSEGELSLADLYTWHVDDATKFYSEALLLEIDLQPDEHAHNFPLGEPIDYVKFSSMSRHVAGVIDMASFAPPETHEQWIPYLHFANVDTGLERATALGAWVLVPKMQTPTGNYALMQDPWGNLFGLWDAASLST